MKDRIITSFDIETTGLNAYAGKKIFAFCIGGFIYKNKEIEDSYVNVYRLDNKDKNLNKRNWQILVDYWRDTNKIKVIHNAKFELHFLKTHGIKIPRDTIIHDTYLMHCILRNLAPSHTLDWVAWELAGYPRELDIKVKQSAKAVGMNYQKIDKNLMHSYQVADGERPLLLFHTFLNALKKNGGLWSAYQIELEVMKSTQIEEATGLHLHLPNIRRLKKWMKLELEKVREEAYNILHEYVNLNSDQQLRRLLFRKFSFPVIKFTDSKVPSVDKDILLYLRENYPHPIYDLILKQRSYTKGLATIRNYMKLQVDGVIYPNLRTIIRTPRKSSSNPNLQNVSKEAALKNPFPVSLRKCFKPAKGYVFIPVDYSGIEMRLIINATGEPELLKMLQKNPDADMHNPTVECFMMKRLFNYKGDIFFKEGIRLAKEFKENDRKGYKIYRGGIKNTGFAIAYGCAQPKVAIILGQPLEEIANGDTNYRNRFQRIANFTKDVIEQVKRDGYIKTAFDRRLFVPRNKPYIGANFKIQGTAAEILKRAQVRLNKWLKKKMYRDIKLVLDVHDEFIFQYPRNLLRFKDEILPEIYQLMVSDFPQIQVPLRVEFSICKYNWNDKENLEVIYNG